MTHPKSSSPAPPRDQWPTSENRSCDVLLGLLPSLGEDWQWCHVCCQHQVWRRWSYKLYFLFTSYIPCPLHPWYRFRLYQHCLPFTNHCTSCMRVYSPLPLTSSLYPNQSFRSSIKWPCSFAPSLLQTDTLEAMLTTDLPSPIVGWELRYLLFLLKVSRIG